MASIPGSVPITGFIAPTDSTDTYPVQDEQYGKGGYRTVGDLTARDNIPAPRRVEGMLVKVLNVTGPGDTKFYTLRGGILNANWVVDLAGGSAQFVHNQIVPAAIWNINHMLGKYPSVTVTDVSGNVINVDVLYVSINSVRVTFITPYVGTAYSN